MSKLTTKKLKVTNPLTSESFDFEAALECKGENIELIFPEKKYIYHFKCNNTKWDVIPEQQSQLDFWDMLDSKDDEEKQYGLDWLFSQYMTKKFGPDWQFDSKEKTKRTRKK